MNVIPRLRVMTRSRRGQRFRRFLSGMNRPVRIVDLGGTARFWEAWGIEAQDRLEITLVNNHHIDKTNVRYHATSPFMHDLLQDATLLPTEFFDQYDLIFSNSFIEHLSDRAEQRKLAAEIVQSGKPYFIQTPNKFSPVDPHFPSSLVPFFAVYPRALQAALLTRSGLSGGHRYPSFAAAQTALQYYNPLGVADVRGLFADAAIEIERPMGVPMSILAYRGSSGAGPGQG